MRFHYQAFSQRRWRLLAIGFCSLALISCGGGGGGANEDGGGVPQPDPGVSISVTFVKGFVSGAACTLFEIGAGGGLGAEIANATTANGQADFGGDIAYEGNALVSCSGGNYIDEATGSSFTAPQMRAVVTINGDATFVVSPLTEISTLLAETAGDLATSLTTYSTLVETVFGITSNITQTVPSDLNTAAAANDAAGQYATVLALLSQLNQNSTGDLSGLIADLTQDLADDSFADTTLQNMGQALLDLAGSPVAGNLSEAAINTILTNAGIPDVSPPGPVADTPNILLIISDDQGLDSSAEYDFTMDPPNTPNISALAEQGLVFENVWAAPTCAPTRAAIITGKHGVNNGVVSLPGDIRDEDETIFELLSSNQATQNYASAFFGKWHIGGGNAPETDPVDNGIPYFAGSVQGNIASYTNWELTIDSTDVSAQTSTSSEYVTSRLTNLAEDWIAQQDSPWFVWFAHHAPHSPFHWPDETLHAQGAEPAGGCDIGANRRSCYLAMIEAMDSEIGNLLDSLPQEQRENTIIIYVGDNGSPAQARDTLTTTGGEVKGSLNEGGVRVPMIVSGYGVTRVDERETRLVAVTDIYATIAELAGGGINSINDSLSLVGYLSTTDGENRTHAYSDYTDTGSVDGWTVRNATHQLVHDDAAAQEEVLYELSPGTFNVTDVTGSAPEILYELQVEGAEVRGELGDLTAMPQGDTVDITDGGSSGIFTLRASTCARFVRAYTASAINQAGTPQNAADDEMFTADMSLSVSNGVCTMVTNNIPNHDLQDVDLFANPVSEQNFSYNIPVAPEFAENVTPLSLDRLQGVFLNGVRIDIFAAACVGVNPPMEATGCGVNPPVSEIWRFDPLFDGNSFAEDSHNAHTQPSGAYHYHGDPHALYDESGATESGVIGFAADGFPIFGSFISDAGLIREVVASYQLKQGNRPVIDLGGSSAQHSEQPYDGTFRQDYEYVEGSGDLDECNGMTVDGIYGYYVTDGFPYVLGCYRGTPDASF